MLRRKKAANVQKADEKEMTFFDHLEELRRHILRSIVAIVVAAIGLFLVGRPLFDEILFGVRNEHFWSYQFMCKISQSWGLEESLCFQPADFAIITTGLGEEFITHIKVAIVGGLVVAFPLVFREFWKFIKPGLYVKERRATRGVIFVCSFLFTTGVFFGYFVIAPFAVNFLVSYSIADIESTVTLTSFINYMIMFTVPAGLAFELPLVVFYLSKLGLATPEGMRKYRKHAIVAILIVASIITPPDVVTQFLIGVPLYFLYEISILVSARENKRQAKLEAEG
ncbi:MAG: twin-arginine translocase subunit TatC [Bacteroidota bacterium]